MKSQPFPLFDVIIEKTNFYHALKIHPSTGIIFKNSTQTNQLINNVIL